jgi:hypothetical protein
MAIDLSVLTAAFDFSSVVPAILAVFAALSGVYITFKAAHLVVSSLRGSIDRKAQKLVNSANFDLTHLEARLVLSQHNGNLKRAIRDVNEYGSGF